MTKKAHWKPQPRQAIMLKRPEDEILAGGARGGGKTDAGMAWLLYDIDNPKYRALVIRRNYTDLGDWIDRAKELYGPSGGKFVGDAFVFPSGAKIRTGHLADKDAYTKYQGHEYQKMLIEELSHIPRETDYLKLLGSCRSTVEGIKPQVFCTTNPDDPGLEWIRDRWDIPEIPDFDKVYNTSKEVLVMTPQGSEKTLLRHLVFVPAKLEDNPILMEADPQYLVYLESLKETDPDLYEAWRHGKWSGFGVEGAYYRHHIAKAYEQERVTRGLYNPTEPVYTWCDIGKGENYGILFMQRGLNKWAVIEYKELTDDEGLHEGIKYKKNQGYIYADHHAPHDMDVKDFSATQSRKQIAKSLGINYKILGQSSVHEGIDMVKTRFVELWFDIERPGVENFLKKLGRYHKEFDEKRGIFKNIPYRDKNCHAADCLRYWAVTKVFIPTQAQEQAVYQSRTMNRSMK